MTWMQWLKRVFNIDIFIEGRSVVLGIIDIKTYIDYLHIHSRLSSN
jgi:hypothetical protein